MKSFAMKKDMRMRIYFFISLALLIFSGATAKEKGPASSFKSRFERLAGNANRLIKITAVANDKIKRPKEEAISPGQYPLIRTMRQRKILAEEEIQSVINRRIGDLKYCYVKALKKNRKFKAEAIVALKIQNNGKVSKVTISPGKLSKKSFGKCLQRYLKKWRFPRFTGEKEKGLKLKSIGYEFPLSFSASG